MNQRRSTNSLNTMPETLFHDEEIAFSGVHLQNPLWEFGDSSSSHSDDPPFPPARLFQIGKGLMPAQSYPRPIHNIRASSKSVACQTTKTLCKGVLAVFVMTTSFALIMLSLTKNTAIWTSSDLIMVENSEDVNTNVVVDRNATSNSFLQCPLAQNDGFSSVSLSDYLENILHSPSISSCTPEVRYTD